MKFIAFEMYTCYHNEDVKLTLKAAINISIISVNKEPYYRSNLHDAAIWSHICLVQRNK